MSEDLKQRLSKLIRKNKGSIYAGFGAILLFHGTPDSLLSTITFCAGIILIVQGVDELSQT